MATAIMATVTMTIPDVEKDVEYTVTTLAKQRNITVAKLLRLILNEYLRQHSIAMKSTQSASTEVSTSSRSLPSGACELIEVDSDVAHGEKISTRNGQITNNLQSSADISSDALEFDQDCVTSKAKRIKTELEGHDNDNPMVDIYLSEIPSSNDHDIEEFILNSSSVKTEAKDNELCDEVVAQDQRGDVHTNLDSDDVLELSDDEEGRGSESNDGGCRSDSHVKALEVGKRSVKYKRRAKRPVGKFVMELAKNLGEDFTTLNEISSKRKISNVHRLNKINHIMLNSEDSDSTSSSSSSPEDCAPTKKKQCTWMNRGTSHTTLPSKSSSNMPLVSPAHSPIESLPSPTASPSAPRAASLPGFRLRRGAPVPSSRGPFDSDLLNSILLQGSAAAASPSECHNSTGLNDPTVVQMIQGIARGVSNLQADFRSQTRELKAIRREVICNRRMIMAPSGIEELPPKLETNLPVTCEEELRDLERELEEEGKKDALKKMLSMIGGSDLKDAVRRLIRTIMDPVYLSEYNWTGKKSHVSSTQKLSFKDLSICPILTGCALQGGYKDGNTLRDVEDAFKVCLRINTDAVTTKLKRHAKNAWKSNVY